MTRNKHCCNLVTSALMAIKVKNAQFTSSYGLFLYKRQNSGKRLDACITERQIFSGSPWFLKGGLHQTWFYAFVKIVMKDMLTSA